MKQLNFTTMLICVTSLIFVPFTAESGSRQVQTGPERWEEEISAIEHRRESSSNPTGGLLFVGSSSIRLWKLEESFPGIHTMNCGFGGSQLADSIHYFERVVVPSVPKAIIVYAGDNDIAEGKSAEIVVRDFSVFCEKTRKQLPAETQLYFIAIKPSIKRWKLSDEMKKANDAIRTYAQSHPNIHFVDIWVPMLDSDGKPLARLFAEDGLHLSAEGYQVWTKELTACLSREGLIP
ncbi:MAG: hypothetical protein JNL58_15470 [Planctomyces sp.]|nr:hypothetical protein [Planctomyces sp.]